MAIEGLKCVGYRHLCGEVAAVRGDRWKQVTDFDDERQKIMDASDDSRGVEVSRLGEAV